MTSSAVACDLISSSEPEILSGLIGDADVDTRWRGVLSRHRRLFDTETALRVNGLRRISTKELSRGTVSTLKERRVLASWNNLAASPEQLRRNASVVFLKTKGCSRKGKSVIPKITDHLALGVYGEANPLPCRSHLDMFNVVVTNQRVAPSDT